MHSLTLLCCTLAFADRFSSQMMGLRLLILTAMSATAAGFDKYACTFDCFLWKDKASTQGYIEYACNDGAAACCVDAQLCITTVAEKFAGMMCPDTATAEPDLESPGAAMYVIGVDSAYPYTTMYPRNSWPMDGGTHVNCTVPLTHKMGHYNNFARMR